MKKLALILFIISFIAIEIFFWGFLMNKLEGELEFEENVINIIRIVFIVHAICSVSFIIYSAINLEEMNFVVWGIILLLFNNPLLGIIFIIVGLVTDYRNVNTGGNYSYSSEFSKLVTEHEKMNRQSRVHKSPICKCSICSREKEMHLQYVVVIDGKRMVLCKECFEKEKQLRGDSFGILSKPIK